ncbi:hypothetical protein K9B33_19580 [Sphingobium sp. 3R8]|uniref:hypothetical protein n=1 Tax=Sphingobium sp. 3R8 TaxID=2874921 RepID=UPI001CCC84A3|nr:hypothetical protein [Sphingobium sp. 3R8]MBZ9649743.1 hypothetical protein [Sphingobium sp. 3R8]
MIDEKELKRLRSAERLRRGVATGVAAVAAVISVIMVLCPGNSQEPSAIRLPILAMMMSIGIVVGARALEGAPESQGGGRRDATAVSAASLVKLWLTSFIALEAAFIIADLSSRMEDLGKKPLAEAGTVKVSGEPVVTEIARRREVQVSNTEEAGHVADASADNAKADGRANEGEQ